MLKRLLNLFSVVTLVLSVFTIAACSDSKPYEKVAVTYMEAVFQADEYLMHRDLPIRTKGSGCF